MSSSHRPADQGVLTSISMKESHLSSKYSKKACDTGFSRREFLELSCLATAAMGTARFPLLTLPTHTDRTAFSGSELADTHDLISLPEWGPYSKKHFGISHIPDIKRGLRFDLSLFPLSPGLPARLPSVTDHDSGVHPWQAAPHLAFYSFRFEMLWKDQVYCDLSFSEIDPRQRLIRMELVNETATPREIVLHSLAQLCFPPLRELTAEPIRLVTAELPAGAVWTDAIDYTDLRFARPRPTDNLVPDGKWRGEERQHDTVGGSVIAQGFGADAGDWIEYRIRLDHSFDRAVLVWRYSMTTGESANFEMDGVARGRVTFLSNDAFSTVTVPLGRLEPGTHLLRFTSRGSAAVALNGFALVEAGQDEQIRFVAQPWHPVPRIDTAAEDNGIILKYQDTEDAYGYSLDTGWDGHRQLKWRELDQAFHCQSGPDTRARIFGKNDRTGDPDSLFIHAWSKPLTIPPRSNRVIHGLVCTGSPDEVSQLFNNFRPHAESNQRIFAAARKNSWEPIAGAAATYDLGQRLLASVTIANLVYPLYTQGSYIRHYSPGKIWDCLYTWDAGFIGLGLLELDTRCAIDALNAYTTPAGAQSAFIHHGTPLPVQIYLYYELWNRMQSQEMLAYFYPRMRQYHLFLAGKLGSSTTRRHQDHLLCTWDYFYNTGGWDDYPPQMFVHEQKITSAVAPAINSSHTIRCAKMLRRIAEYLGHSRDLAEYDDDIATLSSSLQNYSWDQESGYYGYVLHDPAGKPTGILRDSNGVNFNMGLDGVCPLIAGVCSPEQVRQLLDHLFSPQRLWTDIGITTVDQTAPYYSADGYWNGSVWLAHQWFLWKTMLDLGRGDLAVRIAQTGLAIWKHVTDATYDCREHFVPRPPFGEGWDQFSSLSSPALSWFGALYSPGRLTCGFDVWIEEFRFSAGSRRMEATLRCAANPASQHFSVLACMPPASQYRVLWNGRPVGAKLVHEYLLQVDLPRKGGAPGHFEILGI